VIVFSFLPALSNNSYVWDDNVNIFKNPRFSPVTTDKVVSYWEKPFEHLYIPLTYSFWSGIWLITSHFAPNDPDYLIHANVLHVMNLIFHVFNAILIFLIISRVVDDRYSPLLGAILFGIHPVQVETVAFITEFRSLLACFFSLLSIHQYLKYESAGPSPMLDSLLLNPIKDPHYVLSIFFFLLALLSKPISVVIPFILFILNALFFKKRVMQNILNLLPWFIITIPFIVITKASQPDASLAWVTPIWFRPFVIFDSATFYLGKLLYPDILAIDYARTPETVLGHTWGYLTGIVSLGLLIMLWRLRKIYPEYLASYFIFLAGFLPVSGIVPFLFQKFSTVADRYLYFSMMAFALAAASFLRNERNLIHLTPVFLIVIFLMTTTYVQTKIWDDGIQLYNHTLKANPNSYFARNNLANHLRESDLVKAISLYREAIVIKPDYRLALANLAYTITRTVEFFPDYKFSEFISSDEADLRRGKEFAREGLRLFRENQFRRSLEQFGKAVTIDILNPKIYNNLGVLFITNEDKVKSVHFFELALTLDPDDFAAWNNLAVASYKLGDAKAALEYFKNGLDLKPQNKTILKNRERVVQEMAMSENINTRSGFEYLVRE